jgi:pimeloyl-ACP methyl ester carboxylesterase
MGNILLLHGALGAAAQLAPVRVALEKDGASVYDLNFSGHGGEPFAVKFGIGEFAFEVRNFILSNRLNDLTIFGYSMGGYVALCMAYQDPTLVKRIVTLGTKFDWSPTSAARELLKMNPEKIEQKIPAFAHTLQQRHQPNDWKVLMQKTALMMQQLGDSPLLTEEILSGINIPTTIALGDGDDTADRVYSEKVAQCLRNGRFTLLPETPHPIEKVRVERIIEILVRVF